MTTAGLEIRPYQAQDEDALFAAYAAVVEAGGAFPRSLPADREVFRSTWLTDAAATAVAILDGRLTGAYFIRPAFPDLAGHIASAGYLVVTGQRSRGIGTALAKHSLAQAAALGFDAMLFQLVLEGNPSRRLWERLGFVEVGRVPDAFNSQAALMYWQRL